MKSRECARIGRVIDTFRFASGTTPAPNIAMKRILLPVLAVLLAAPAFAATTGSATKPVGASADLTTSTSGAVDSYSGAYATEGWYQPAAAFDDILPVDSNTGNNRARAVLYDSTMEQFIHNNWNTETMYMSDRWVDHVAGVCV